jgi:hypothetical protein
MSPLKQIISQSSQFWDGAFGNSFGGSLEDDEIDAV